MRDFKGGRIAGEVVIGGDGLGAAWSVIARGVVAWVMACWVLREEAIKRAEGIKRVC